MGSNADAAIIALRNTEHDLQAIGLEISPPRVATMAANDCDTQELISLTESIDTYLAEVRRFKSPKTIAACERMLTLFGARFTGRQIKDITRKDLLDHMSFHKEKGLGYRIWPAAATPRTVVSGEPVVISPIPPLNMAKLWAGAD